MPYRTDPTASFDDALQRTLFSANRGRRARIGLGVLSGLLSALAAGIWLSFSLGVIGPTPLVGGLGPHGFGYSFDPRQLWLVLTFAAPPGFIMAHVGANALRPAFRRWLEFRVKRHALGLNRAEREELVGSARALV